VFLKKQNIHFLIKGWFLMKKTLALVSIMAVLLFNCTTSSPTSTNNSNPYMSTASGTVSGSVTGTISGGVVWIMAVNSGQDLKGEFQITASYSSSSTSNQLNITSPSGLSGATFTSSIGFLQTPAPGTYTNTSATSCGGIEFTLSSSTTTSVFGVINKKNCDGTAGDSTGGAYSIVLTSVTPVTSVTNGVNSVSYYRVNGSLDATIPGNMITTAAGTVTAGSVTVHLSF
jgi:hypothetical protein